jgi:hypothetical protein
VSLPLGAAAQAAIHLRVTVETARFDERKNTEAGA